MSDYSVVIGSVGTGKTSLVNKISGKTFKTWTGGESCTREVNIVELNLNGRRLLVADTPGLNSEKEKIDHALHILSALEYNPLSAMFITVKYDRQGPMTKVLDPILRKLLKFKNVICLVITFWDDAVKGFTNDKKNPIDEERTVIEFLSKRYKVRAFVTSKDASADEITQKMLGNLSAPLTLKLSTAEVSKYFDLEGDDFDVKNKIEDLKDTLKETVEFLRNYSKQFDTVEEKTDYFYFSQLAINDYCILLAQEFSKEMGYDYLDDSTSQYPNYLALQTSLRSVVEDYRQFAASQMNVVVFSNTGSHPDTKDYRRCPHCRLIWYRVTACPNVTCGCMETEKDVLSSLKNFFNFKFQWTKGQKPKISYESQMKKYNFATPKTANGKALGCGKGFDWLAQAPVPKEEMDEFFQTEVTDVNVIEEKVENAAVANMEQERAKVKAPKVHH